MTSVELNPAQRAVIELLGRRPDRPALAEGLASELEAELCVALAPLAEGIGADEALWASKRSLSTVHGCEAHHVATDRHFAWSVPAARGTVAHKAIELMVHWRGAPVPGDLVDESLARLVERENGLAEFLARLGEGDRAELRSIAVDRVTKFQECFPRLKAEWCPVTESPARVELFDGRIVLAAKTDLTLGRPGAKVVIDLKSGRASPTHRDDLRFYALVETLRLGVPPRMVASYYLDAARAEAEEVTEGLLVAALRRTVDGIARMLALRAGEVPRRRAGPACRWCPLRPDCPDAAAAAAASGDDSDEGGASDGW